MLSRKKKARMARAEREAYVLKCSYTNSVVSPFYDWGWDEAAKRYIETGDEALKKEFPSPRSNINTIK